MWQSFKCQNLLRVSPFNRLVNHSLTFSFFLQTRWALFFSRFCPIGRWENRLLMWCARSHEQSTCRAPYSFSPNAPLHSFPPGFLFVRIKYIKRWGSRSWTRFLPQKGGTLPSSLFIRRDPQIWTLRIVYGGGYFFLLQWKGSTSRIWLHRYATPLSGHTSVKTDRVRFPEKVVTKCVIQPGRSRHRCPCE